MIGAGGYDENVVRSASLLHTSFERGAVRLRTPIPIAARDGHSRAGQYGCSAVPTLCAAWGTKQQLPGINPRRK